MSLDLLDPPVFATLYAAAEYRNPRLADDLDHAVTSGK